MLMTVTNGGALVLILLVIITGISLLSSTEKLPLEKNEKRLLQVIGFYIFVSSVSIFILDSSISEFDNTTRFIILLPVFFYARRQNIDASMVLYGIFLGALACFLIAMYQVFLLEMPRATGVSHPVIFGGISITLGLMCISAVIFSKSNKFTIFMILGFIFGSIASILSGSRGAWLALLSCFVYFIWSNPIPLSVRHRIIVSLIFVFTILACYQIPDIQLRVDYAIQNIDAYSNQIIEKNSLGLRLETWKAGFIIFFENPVFGIGEGNGNFITALTNLTNRGEIAPAIPTSIAHIHNEYLSAAMHRGIFGLLSLMILFLFPLWVFKQGLLASNGTPKILLISGIMLILCSMTISLSDVFFQHHNHTLFFVTYLYLFFGLVSSERCSRETAKPDNVYSCS